MLRAIIVDDEELAVKRLNRILSESGEIDVCDTFLNPLEAYEYVKAHPIDLAFLDISMPEINGMRLSSLLLDLDAALEVVFVTGYDDYAIQAFDMSALDYLLKPVAAQRISITLDKIRKRHEYRLRDRIKVLISQSMTLQRTGQTEAALVELETALQLAEPEGYLRSFTDEGPLMAEMLAAYLKVQQGNGLTDAVSLAYVQQLIQAFHVAPEEKRALKENLTEQETRVLQFIAGGLSNKEIADRLNITGETVKSHIKNVYRKLDVNKRVQALQRAKELMLLL